MGKKLDTKSILLEIDGLLDFNDTFYYKSNILILFILLLCVIYILVNIMMEYHVIIVLLSIPKKSVIFIST